MSQDFLIVARNVAIGVAGFHIEHTGQFTHPLFCAPEAAHAKNDAFAGGLCSAG